MGRHANGKNTYSLAGWVIAVIVAIIAVIALVLWLMLGNNDDGDDSTAAQEDTQVTSEEQTAEETTEESSAEEESAEETTSEEESSEPSTPAAPAGLEFAPNTLFLLDTSDALAPNFDAVTGAMVDAANELGGQDGAVALWNYSSPLSETATVGYRQNVSFGPANNVTEALPRFGTGGVPQTRSAVTAALGNAIDQANDTGDKVNVVLVTTGTAQDMDDNAFRAQLGELNNDNVSLAVVHLGDGETDAVLEDSADYFGTVSNPGDQAAVAQELNEAAGI